MEFSEWGFKTVSTWGVVGLANKVTVRLILTFCSPHNG